LSKLEELQPNAAIRGILPDSFVTVVTTQWFGSEALELTYKASDGRVMLARMGALARARRDFAFETTLASRSFVPWLASLRASGYRVHLAFLSLSGPDLAVARVAERVRQGGHDVPEPVVRRRFATGLKNFFSLYQAFADTWQMFDNSAADGPRLVATGRAGQPPTVLDAATWADLQEGQR
jgi:predicted ABC-type ATPase